MSRIVVGVDVGGTFTDVFALDETSAEVRTAKVPSTRSDQSQGFVAGIAETADFAALASVVHGTTVATNALLERRGARAGIIATKGFRDVIEMRRRDRPTTWGLRGRYRPIVPRRHRLEVPERTLADGTVETEVDLAAVRAAAQALAAAGVEALCIAFINAYANPANERAAAEAVRAVWPTPYVTASHEILPEIREFERTSTAALNATLQPVVASYLDRLTGALEGRGARSEILMVQSNGGVMDIATAKAAPVRTALSGPAAGVIAAERIAASAGYGNVITGDMGGTSFDVALIANGASALAAQTSVDFGLVIRTPMIEITTIGAGGGSIASVDAGGLLQVGPESAGAEPGPAAYGLGNDRPTVTDANVLLGRINPERPIGGGLARLDVAAAERAIMAHVGTPLGLEPVDAADAILRVANAKLAGAIRLVSIERGHDPSAFVLMPFGGGGALHAGALVEAVGLKGALVPRFPGVTSALGCVVADMRRDVVRTINAPLASADLAALETELRSIAEAETAALARSGARLTRTRSEYALDMLYVGQTHTLSVPLCDGPLDEATVRGAFETAYAAAFGKPLDNVPLRIVNLHVTVIGERPAFDLMALAPRGGRPAAEAVLGRRPVVAAGETAQVPVYDRLAIAPCETIDGPAIFEQPDTTIFLEPSQRARVDRLGNLFLERRR